MSYLQQSNKNIKKGNRRTFIVVILLCVFIVFSFAFPGFLYSISVPIFSPFWRVESFVFDKFGRGIELLRSKESLVRENEVLKKKEIIFDSTSLSLDDALSQNETLKQLLGRTDKFKYVLGVIIRKPPYSPYDTLIIDVGKNNGVEVGDRVFVPDNVLIGDVVEVYSKTSKVSLLSSPEVETAIVVGKKNVEATAFGRGGGNFLVELPAGAEIELGDTIKSPSLGVSIMGVVEDIKTDQSGTLRSILFKSPFNIHDLYFVEVETGVI